MVVSRPGILPTPGGGGDRQLPLVGSAPRMVSIADVFAAHQPRIRRYVLSLVRDPAEADDLTQEVFLRAHRKLGSLRDPDLVLPWLYRVATNVCHDRFRQRARQPQLDGSGPDDQVVANATPESGAPVDVEREAVRSEMSACVQGYVSELSDGYRQVILLHDAEGLTNPEIAEMLGVSVDAVKIRLHRARRKLQALLADNCAFSHDDRNVFVCDPASPDHPTGPA